MIGLTDWQDVHVWVTRPAEKSQETVEHLLAQGANAFSGPLQTLQPMPLTGADRTIVQDLDQFRVVIVVSQFAAALACEHLDEYWPQWPVGIEWWAIGSATGELLKKQGIAPVYWPTTETSEGLVAEPEFAIQPGDRVLIIKGEGGRDYLRQHITERGARATEWSVYRREACPPDSAASVSGQDYNVVWVTSQENLEILYSVADHDKLLNSLIVVPSQRIADRAKELGIERLLVVDSAHDASLISGLNSLFER